MPRIAAATNAGVTFVDPTTASMISTTVLPGGAHGLADVSGIDDQKLYATSGDAAAPTYHVIGVVGERLADGPVSAAAPTHCPASVLGHPRHREPDRPYPRPARRRPGRSSRRRHRHGPEWTVYVVEPHGNAVFADARLRRGLRARGLGRRRQRRLPGRGPPELLVFDGSGSMSSIDAGLARVCVAAARGHRRRDHGRVHVPPAADPVQPPARRRSSSALFVLFDGMFFVQSRIGMNDVYVGLFIVAAYTVFAALWTGWWRARCGLLGGDAGHRRPARPGPGDKWVAPMPSARLVLLILIRSALGRVVAILGLIALTGVLGYMAITVPPRQRHREPHVPR